MSSEESDASEQSWIVGDDHCTQSDLEDAERCPIDRFQIRPAKTLFPGSSELSALQGYSLSGQGLPVPAYSHSSPLLSKWSQDLLRDVKRCLPAASRKDLVDAVKKLRPASSKSYIQSKIRTWCSVKGGQCLLHQGHN